MVAGSARRWWHSSGIPLLVDAGALRRVGRRWLGRRSLIERALTSPGKETSTTERATP